MRLVSVILPNFNGSRYIAQAIESVLDQTYKRLEIIVIDDGSTDDSWDIISAYSDGRLVRRRHERNQGLIATLNEAIDISNGDYIARMDSDDISCRHRIAHQVDYLEKWRDVDVLGTAIVMKGVGIPRYRRFQRSDSEIRVSLLFANCIAHPSVMFRASTIRLNQLRYEHTDLYAEDLGLWTRMARTARFANIGSADLIYRVHPGSVSMSRRAQQVQSVGEILENYWVSLGIELSAEERTAVNIANSAGADVTNVLHKLLERSLPTLSRNFSRQTLATVLLWAVAQRAGRDQSCTFATGIRAIVSLSRSLGGTWPMLQCARAFFIFTLLKMRQAKPAER